MTKRKKDIMKVLVAERYLVWAIVCAITVSSALVAQISIAKAQMDEEMVSSLYLLKANRK